MFPALRKAFQLGVQMKDTPEARYTRHQRLLKKAGKMIGEIAVNIDSLNKGIDICKALLEVYAYQEFDVRAKAAGNVGSGTDSGSEEVL
jgi:hypothetical protein